MATAAKKLAVETPYGRQCRRDAALRDLQAEFHDRWYALTAEFAARRARIEREYPL